MWPSDPFHFKACLSCFVGYCSVTKICHRIQIGLLFLQCPKSFVVFFCTLIRLCNSWNMHQSENCLPQWGLSHYSLEHWILLSHCVSITCFLHSHVSGKRMRSQFSVWSKIPMHLQASRLCPHDHSIFTKPLFQEVRQKINPSSARKSRA